MSAKPPFPLGKDKAPYRKIAARGVRVERVMVEEVLVVPREALPAVSEATFTGSIFEVNFRRRTTPETAHFA